MLRHKYEDLKATSPITPVPDIIHSYVNTLLICLSPQQVAAALALVGVVVALPVPADPYQPEPSYNVSIPYQQPLHILKTNKYASDVAFPKCTITYLTPK